VQKNMARPQGLYI